MKSKKVRQVKDSPSALAFSSPQKRGLLRNLAEAQKNIKTKFKHAYADRMNRERILSEVFKPVTSKFKVATVEQKKKLKKEGKNDDSPKQKNLTPPSSDDEGDGFFHTPPYHSPPFSVEKKKRSYYLDVAESIPRWIRDPPGRKADGPKIYFPGGSPYSKSTSAGPRLEENMFGPSTSTTPPRISSPINRYLESLQTPRMSPRDILAHYPTPRVPATAASRVPMALRRLHTDANFGDSPADVADTKRSRKKRNNPNESDGKQGKSIESNFIPYHVNDHIIYEYFDDPNELCERLRLLTSSRAAGNTNHMQEINSIIEELRELGYVH